MNVMLEEGGILTAVDSAPDACEKVWWGKRLAAVGVALPRVERGHSSRTPRAYGKSCASILRIASS